MEESQLETSENLLDFIEYGSGTDVGMKREENQDSFGVIRSPAFHFYLVADGMGGVKGGAIASKMAIEIFSSEFENSNSLDSRAISEAVQLSNRKVYQAGVEDPTLTGMGTTFVGLGFTNDGLFVLNVGDSRAYRIRSEEIELLTEDHTLINELVRSGALTAEQAENHPVSHMLTRSLGPTESVQPDCWLRRDGPAAGDKYVICSDGLYNHVTPEEIRSMVLTHSIDEISDELIALANSRGGSDNITIVVAAIQDSYPLSPSDFSEEALQTIELYLPTHDSGQFDESQLVNGHHSSESSEAGESMLDTDSSEESSPRLESGVELQQVHIDGVEQDESFDEELAEEADDSELSKEVVPRRWPVVFLLSLAGFASVGLYYLLMQGQSVQPVLPSIENEAGRSRLPASSKDFTLGDAEETARESVEVAAVNELKKPEPPEPAETVASQPEQPSPDVQSAERTIPAPEVSVSELEARVAALVKRKERINEQISSFSKPISGKLAESITLNGRLVENLRRELDSTRSQLDVATRRLAVWFGRRKRLRRMAPVNLAAEVAASDELVREKKAEFDRVTWELLKADEERRYNPNDPELQKRAKRLSEARRKMNAELGVAIEAAIEDALATSDQQITDLTLKRDKVERELSFAERELAYARILMSGTPGQKEEKLEKLTLELSELENELSHLDEVMDAQKGQSYLLDPPMTKTAENTPQ